MAGLTVEPIPGAATAGAELDNPFEALRRQRARLAESNTEVFPLPGYDDLFARYKRLGLKETREITNDFATPEIERDAQFLIASCEEIWREVDEQHIHVSYGYDDDLAVALGIRVIDHDMGAARQVVLGTFGYHEHLVDEHSGEVYRWMVSTVMPSEDAAKGS